MIVKQKEKKDMEMNPMRSSFVEYDIIDDIGYLFINNGATNTIDVAEFLDFNEFHKWVECNHFKGLIITGKGRHFSDGANINNIKAFKNNTKKLETQLNKGKKILNYIEKLPIITVAAISGVCFGAGFEIGLSCQYRICTTNSLFSFPESGLGIMPGLGGTIRLPNLIGLKKACEIILSGIIITSNEAYEFGIVDKVVKKGENVVEAVRLIKSLTDMREKDQIECIIKSLNNYLSEDVHASYELESRMFSSLVKNL